MPDLQNAFLCGGREGRPPAREQAGDQFPARPPLAMKKGWQSEGCPPHCLWDLMASRKACGLAFELLRNNPKVQFGGGCAGLWISRCRGRSEWPAEMPDPLLARTPTREGRSQCMSHNGWAGRGNIQGKVGFYDLSTTDPLVLGLPRHAHRPLPVTSPEAVFSLEALTAGHLPARCC